MLPTVFQLHLATLARSTRHLHALAPSAIYSLSHCHFSYNVTILKRLSLLSHCHSSEKDLDEVLQTTAIFSNVGKGVFAAKEDLQVRTRFDGLSTEVTLILLAWQA